MSAPFRLQFWSDIVVFTTFRTFLTHLSSLPTVKSNLYRTCLIALFIVSLVSTPSNGSDSTNVVVSPMIIEAGVLLQSGQIVEGIEVLRQIAERSERPGWIYHRIAEAYIDLFETDSAAHYVALALEEDRTPSRLLLATRIARDQFRPEEEIRGYLQEILALEPENHTALHLLALTSMVGSVDSHERTLEYLDRLLEVGGENPDIVAEQFDLLIKTGRHERANAVASRLLAISPDPVTRGGVLAAQALHGTVDDALLEFDRGCQIYEGRELWTFLDVVMSSLESPRPLRADDTPAGADHLHPIYHALIDTLSARSHERTVPSALLLYGVLIASKSDQEGRAHELFASLSHRESLRSETCLALAVALLEQNSHDLSLQILQQITPESGVRARWYGTRGKAYFLAGQLQKARLEIAQSLREGEDDPETWLLSARLHAMAEERSQAVRAFEKSLELDPFNLTTIAFYARFIAEHGVQVKRGGELVRTILEGNENDHELLESYARIALLQDELARAEALLWVVHQERGLSPFGYHTFGEVYERRGDSRHAGDAFQKGLDLLRSGDALSDQTIPEAAGRKERTEQELLRSIQRLEKE